MAQPVPQEIIDCARGVADEPFNPVLRIRFARICRDVGELGLARAHYEEAIRLSPHMATARIEYSHVVSQLQATPAQGQRHVLLLGSATGQGHTNTDAILASKELAVTTILVEYWDLDTPLPPASVALNAISDADACGSALDIAAALLAQSPHLRVLNAPSRVRLTGRVSNAVRLASIPGLVVPAVTIVSREELLDSNAPALLRERGATFPLLLRTPGKNNGEEIVKVDHPAELPAACGKLPGEGFLATNFVDTRREDGMIRKYRVMNVAGTLYPLHAARSQHWNVHYTHADESADAVAEEERFLEDMEAVLDPQAIQALQGAFDALQLDYAGVDFGIAKDGRVVLYEANATMTIYVPERFGPGSVRRRAAQTIVTAARHLVAGTR